MVIISPMKKKKEGFIAGSILINTPQFDQIIQLIIFVYITGGELCPGDLEI